MELKVAADEFAKIQGEFVKRGEFLRMTSNKYVEDKADPNAAAKPLDVDYDFNDLRFTLQSNLLIEHVIFRPGVFFIDPNWGKSLYKDKPNSKFRVISIENQRKEYTRSYNNVPQTNAAIAALMESSWRDFYFLCAQVIQNYKSGGFKFNDKSTLRLPFWDDQENVNIFLSRPADQLTLAVINSPGGKQDPPLKLLGDSLYTSWFEEDLPMFSPRKRSDEEERSYLLSCLDKAAFLSNYGSLFQKTMGYDVSMRTLASPFLMEPWEHLDNKTTNLILNEFKLQMDSINAAIEAFKLALEQKLKPFQETLFQVDSDPAIEYDEVERAKFVKDKIASYIATHLTNPIEQSVKKLVSSQETIVALKDSKLRVGKLEREIFRLKKGGYSSEVGGGVLGGVPGEVSKTRKLYLETAIRFEVQKRLRAEFPLFRFGDQLAGTAAIATQRVLRFDFDELITRDVAEKVLPDIGDKELPNIQAYYERSLTPFKESFNSLNLFAPSTQAAIAVCLERVKLMTFMGGKGGRSGRREILVEDLTDKNQELSVAFATLVALELQVNQEVQRKTSSTHHDQIKLAASVQNADNLMRGLLIKHGWACYPNQFDEANSTRGARPGGF
jgi:hypothetical protein